MEQMLLAYGLTKETVAVTMMLHKNSNVKVCSLDGDTDYFDIVAGVLQRDTLALYLFIIYLDYVLRMSIDLMKENGFKLAKERSRRYPAQTIMNVDYADDILLPANTLTQPESLQYSLEQAAGGKASMSTQTRQNTKKRHLHTKGWSFETCGQIH